MPRYDYECLACGNTFEAVSTVERRHDVSCPECHGNCRILIITKPHYSIFESYDSPTFKCRVRSNAHKRRLMDEHHLEEYTSIDECEREADRLSKEEDKKASMRGPDEKFIECYNKALAENP